MTELEKYRKNIEKAREAYNNGNLKEVNRYLKDFYDNEKTIEDCEIKMQKEVLKNLK